MALKKIGYYISKGKCLKVYSLKKKNSNGRLVTKKVNYRSKALRKGTKVYKTKKLCIKALSKKIKRKSKPKPKPKSKSKPKSKKYAFGDYCYSKPFFNHDIATVPRFINGVANHGLVSSIETLPGSLNNIDFQQGSYKSC